MANVHVITGGSSGIGLECAKLFTDGVVLIAGRTEEKLKSACDLLKKEGVDAKYKSTDVSDRKSVKDLMNYAKELGTLKSIVHAAGVSGAIGDVMKTLKIDLLGTYNVIEETYDAIGENASLILIASMMGHMVPRNIEIEEALINPQKQECLEKIENLLEKDADQAYNYAKHGVQLLAKVNTTRFGKKGASIVSVSPGIIMTPMAKKASEDYPEKMEYMNSITPMGRSGEPEDISELVHFLASDKAKFITGTDILVDGGLTLNLKEEKQI